MSGHAPGDRIEFLIAKPGGLTVRFLHTVHGTYRSPLRPALASGAIVIGLAGPVRVDGRVIIDQGYYVLRDDFQDQWHNLCLFFTPRGRLTGYYCDLQTPLRLRGNEARCTDLCLDLWVFAGETGARVLDRDEYRTAVRAGLIPAHQRRRAATALRRLLEAERARRFPLALTGDRAPATLLSAPARA